MQLDSGGPSTSSRSQGQNGVGAVVRQTREERRRRSRREEQDSESKLWPVNPASKPAGGSWEGSGVRRGTGR